MTGHIERHIPQPVHVSRISYVIIARIYLEYSSTSIFIDATAYELAQKRVRRNDRRLDRIYVLQECQKTLRMCVGLAGIGAHTVQKRSDER